MKKISIDEFESVLTKVASQLTNESRIKIFPGANRFEQRVREVLSTALKEYEGCEVDMFPPPQAFPDIAINEYGVEVKFTTSDNWRCIGNSIQEAQRVETVKYVYLMYGKMGGTPEVRWRYYEASIVHVRTSHVPRFEVQAVPDENNTSLFRQMEISYDDFRVLPIEDKMVYVREYARKIHPDGRLWWIGEEHSTPAQARLYTNLTNEEKIRYRAEAAIVSPKIVGSGRAKNKYDDVVLYLLTYRGILCHQARDLFSAGSVANSVNTERGGIYIQKSLILIEDVMREIAPKLENSIFVEYWGERVPPEKRISRWLELADKYAVGWKPSEVLFKHLKI